GSCRQHGKRSPARWANPPFVRKELPRAPRARQRTNGIVVRSAAHRTAGTTGATLPLKRRRASARGRGQFTDSSRAVALATHGRATPHRLGAATMNVQGSACVFAEQGLEPADFIALPSPARYAPKRS